MPNFREGSWKAEVILPSLTKQESNMAHTQVLPSKQLMSRPHSLKTAGTGVGVGVGGGHHGMSVPEVITYVSGSGSFSFWDFCGP